tara:strand:- start:441 stop:617 length:177 start_codon:yes stop_codon:yes gene_type:complete
VDKFTDKLNGYLKKYFAPELLSNELLQQAQDIRDEEVKLHTMPTQQSEDSPKPISDGE